jgi:hypothetical protein
MTEKSAPRTSITPIDPLISGDGRNGLDRRRFVGLVGASLAAQWLIDPPSLGWSATAAAPDGTVLVPGYLRASHLAMTDESVLRDLSDPLLPPHDTLRRVIPEGLPLEFISSTEIGRVPMGFEEGCARIRVHGVLPPREFSLADNVEALHLEAEISLEQEMAPFGHYVWGFDKDPVENISGPTRFDVPVGKGVALRLWTSFEWAGRGAVRGGSDDGKGRAPVHRCSTILTLNDRYGEPKLRPGVYCLPLSDEAQKAFPLVANRDWLVPDELPYLLMSVQPVVSS